MMVPVCEIRLLWPRVGEPHAGWHAAWPTRRLCPGGLGLEHAALSHVEGAGAWLGVHSGCSSSGCGGQPAFGGADMLWGRLWLGYMLRGHNVAGLAATVQDACCLGLEYTCPLTGQGSALSIPLLWQI